MEEKSIESLFSDEEGTVPVTVRIPKILLDMLVEAYREKVGATRSRGILTDAILYFSARGLLSWQERNISHPRPAPRQQKVSQ